MEDRSVLLHDAPDSLAIEDHPGLVVGHHDRDDGRIGPERLTQFLEIKITHLVDLEIGHLVTVPLFEIPAKAQHGRMLNGGGDQVPFLRIGVQGADDGEIVALGTTAGEHYLARLLRPQQGLDLFPGRGHLVAGTGSEGMHARGVAEMVGQQGDHLLEDFRGHRGRGVVVEVDALLRRFGQPLHHIETLVTGVHHLSTSITSRSSLTNSRNWAST